MSKILETPLADDFYKEKGWVKSLVGFYGEKSGKLPVAALQKPMEMLAHALFEVTYIYGNFPDVVYNALGQTIDPLFAPDEYRTMIYESLKASAIEEDRPLLDDYAEAIYTIRRLYGRDNQFFNEHFAKEIAAVPASGMMSQQEKFGSVIQEITKIHVGQVRKMLADRK